MLHTYMQFNMSLDIDECLNMTANCDVHAVCSNTIGSFQCTCALGYTGNGTYCSGIKLQKNRAVESV